MKEIDKFEWHTLHTMIIDLWTFLTQKETLISYKNNTISWMIIESLKELVKNLLRDGKIVSNRRKIIKILWSINFYDWKTSLFHSKQEVLYKISQAFWIEL